MAYINDARGNLINPATAEGQGIVGPNTTKITTNVENDASGRMNRVDKMFHKLALQKLVTFVERKEVFYTEQNVWKLNVRNYLAVRQHSQ